MTIFEDGKGNCYAACLASILELPLEEVPNFVTIGEDMDSAIDEWLAPRGLMRVELVLSDQEAVNKTLFRLRPGGSGFCILSGKSPRKRADGRDKGHGVVAKCGGWGLPIAHDPHPSRDGLRADGFRTVEFFVGKVQGCV